MKTMTLGSTGITVNRNGFGALPVQRVSVEEAGRLLRKAFENGIRFFDTARSYSDSEMKIGLALSDVRDQIISRPKRRRRRRRASGRTSRRAFRC